MYSRNLFVLDVVRRFFVRCAQKSATKASAGKTPRVHNTGREEEQVEKEKWENQRDAQRERMTEEERRRRRRALRRKREQQRRRRLIAVAAVAVLVLGGGAVEIVHSILRDAQMANVGSSADSGQAGSDGTITERLQENGTENAEASDDGNGGAGNGTDSTADESGGAGNGTDSAADESSAAAGTDMSRTDGVEDDESGNSTGEAADTEQDISFSETVQLDTLNSPYAILMDASTGEVLAEQNADTQMYPASMTKILTAVTAMESVNSLDEIVTMPYEIYATLYEEGASMAGFEAGEQASVRQLLYGVILPSGAECCIALADLIDGSESAFVQRMNEKAQALGMSSTHFVTCTGLHDAQHYSTVRDIAVLLQYALQSSDFREIFTAHSHSVAPTAQHPEGFTFYSTMFQSLGDASVTGGEILGGKTGYTEEAGLCLASLAQVNGREYILVTAGAPGSHDTEPLHTIDAKAVYNRIGEATKN